MKAATSQRLFINSIFVERLTLGYQIEALCLQVSLILDSKLLTDSHRLGTSIGGYILGW